MVLLGREEVDTGRLREGCRGVKWVSLGTASRVSRGVPWGVEELSGWKAGAVIGLPTPPIYNTHTTSYCIKYSVILAIPEARRHLST